MDLLRDFCKKPGCERYTSDSERIKLVGTYFWVRQLAPGLTFEVFLEKIWGPPDLTTGEVTAWKIKPLDAPVEIAVSFQSNQRPSRRSRR